MADLTRRRIMRDIQAIVERVHPRPRGQHTIPVALMEQELVEYAEGVIRRIHSDTSSDGVQLSLTTEEAEALLTVAYEGTGELWKTLDDDERKVEAFTTAERKLRTAVLAARRRDRERRTKERRD